MGLNKNTSTPQRTPKMPGNDTPVLGVSGGYYFNVDGHNRVVEAWVPKVRTQLKSNAMVMFPDGKGKSPVLRPGRSEIKLKDSITSRIKKEFGAAERITFNFERHGVFVHKGVGSGYKMAGGKVLRVAKTDSGEPRTPQEWFNPVLNELLPELADRLAEVNADIVLNASRMMIR